MTDERSPTRREWLLGTLGGAAAGAVLGGCSSSGSAPDASTTPDAGAPGPDATVGSDSAADAVSAEPDAPVTECTVYPRQTEGPFYLDLGMLRRDVTEGKAGTPLRVEVRVLAADGCRPLQGVAVDIWQCDAAGVYSGFPGQLGGLDTSGQTFLRGTQVTGDDGRATFDTIYPGWYPGRTTHIHFKVHPTATTEAVSQLYFPEDVNGAVYMTGVYAARGPKDTSNTADGVNRGVVPPLLEVVADGAGYVGRLVVTVA